MLNPIICRIPTAGGIPFFRYIVYNKNGEECEHMKSMVRLFAVLVVGIAVFLGGLLIAQGMRAHRAGEAPTAGQTQETGMQPVSRESLFEKEEGSAL